MSICRRDDNGFGPIELLIIVVVLGILTFGGLYFFTRSSRTNTKATTTKTTSKAATPEASQPAKTPAAKTDKPVTLTKVYADSGKNFTVKYPSDWVLKETTTSGEDSTATLTSPTGTVLNLKADLGGRGGDCEPGASEKPFAAGNTCPTKEYLSSDVVPGITNVYYASRVNQPNGQINFSYKKTDIVLVTAHYADPSGASTYIIGLTASNDANKVTLNAPVMGLYVPYEFFTVSDANGQFHPYIYAYATGSSQAFLSSKDIPSITAILKSMDVLK
jgi:Tfp pilus assembly protein PilE